MRLKIHGLRMLHIFLGNRHVYCVKRDKRWKEVTMPLCSITLYNPSFQVKVQKEKYSTVLQ